MKIIQSLWTKPYKSKENLEKTKAFYELSSKYLKQAGFEVDLYTDALGAELFNKSKNYKNIYTNLNKIDHINPELWSCAKIFSMLEVNEPSLHIDGDVFIKKPEIFKKIIESDWDVIVQAQEISEHWYYFYDKSIEIFNTIFKFDTDLLANNNNLHNKLKQYNYTYNCGLLGFKEFKTFKEYAAVFFKIADFLNKNIDLVKKYESLKDRRAWVRGAKVNINCIIEQVQLVFFVNYYNLYVKEFIPIYKWNDFKWQYFQNFSEELGYEHFAGAEKFEMPCIYEQVLNEIELSEVSSEDSKDWKNY